jgi:hypothetical protein
VLEEVDCGMGDSMLMKDGVVTRLNQRKVDDVHWV